MQHMIAIQLDRGPTSLPYDIGDVFLPHATIQFQQSINHIHSSSPGTILNGGGESIGLADDD